MATLPGSPRRRALTVGLVAALVPLVLLLGLQWVWLGRLESATRIARQAAVRNFADAVTAESESYYRTTAERALVPPTGGEDLPGEFTRLWTRRPVDGARTLFLVDYFGEPFGRVLKWDPQAVKLISPPASDEALAIIVACTPFQMASYYRRTVETASPLVDERDPEHRIVLLPIVDPDGHVLGVSGMVLDEAFFVEQLVPRVLARADAEGLTVSVRDPRSHAAATTPEATEAAADGARMERHFPWVFTDWSLAVAGPPDTAESWARAGFTFNMTLSVLLAAALLGGLIFAFNAARRAVQLSEMKSDFVSNVSHELRTPLASIRALGELLKLGRVTPQKVSEYGDHIETESRRLSRLIDNLLDFSRIESGRKTYRFTLRSLEEVVGPVVEAFGRGPGAAGFEVEYVRPDTPLPPLPLDADAVGQAVHNLLDNAAKYSGDSRRIRVTLAREDGFAVCAVRDWGIGIPRDEQAAIFDRFHRVGSALVHDVKGTGLGLSIVRHVLAAHAGACEVDSESGRGTTIRLRFPLEGGPAPSAKDPEGGRT